MSTLLPIDAASSAVLYPPLTNAEMEALAIASDWFPLERSKEGKILMHPPTGFLTGDGNGEITFPAPRVVEESQAGQVIDSNGTFFLPDSSMLSPDASYVQPDKLKELTKDDLTGFPRLCPDFVVELLSTSDRLPKVQEKIERWLENGATFGWLIDLIKRRCTSTYLAARRRSNLEILFADKGPSTASPSILKRFGAAMRFDPYPGCGGART